MKEIKTGQAASETATESTLEHISRAAFAASTVILCVSCLDILITFTCTLIPEPAPPTSSPQPPPGGGGSGGSSDLML